MHSSVGPSVWMSDSARYIACRLPVFRFGSLLPPGSQPFLSRFQLTVFNFQFWTSLCEFLNHVLNNLAQQSSCCAQKASLYECSWLNVLPSTEEWLTSRCFRMVRPAGKSPVLPTQTRRPLARAQSTCNRKTSWNVLPSAVADSKSFIHK